MSASANFPDSAQETAGTSARVRGFGAWIGLLLIIAFVVVVRSRWLNLPLERDEGEFAYGGQLMLEGVPPFKLLYNIKQPGMQVAYALIMAVFGQTPSGIHCGLIVVNVAAIILTFFLARRFFNSAGAVAAAWSYGLMSLSWSYLGAAAHATQFVAMASLAGLLTLDRAEESRGRLTLFGAGLWCGLAFELKQQGLMFAVFGAVYLFYVEWQRASTAKTALARLSLFGAGCVTPYLLTCLWLWRAGVFGNFWKWTWQYAYAHSLTFGQGWEHLKYAITGLTRPDDVFWILAMIGLGWTLCRKDFAARGKIFLAGLSACALCATAMGLYFHSHYFVLLLPAIALINGSVFDAMWRTWQSGPLFLVILLWFCAIFEMKVQFSYWFTMPPTEIIWHAYHQAPFTGALVAAQYIQANSLPAATVAVLESEPEIYFYAHRRSATGYIYAYDFMSQRTYGREMQEEAIREIESTHPEWIVFVSSPLAWGVIASSSKAIFDWGNRYIPAHYDLVGVVDQQQAGEVICTWGKDAAAAAARMGPAGLKIFKRKSAQEGPEFSPDSKSPDRRKG